MIMILDGVSSCRATLRNCLHSLEQFAASLSIASSSKVSTVKTTDVFFDGNVIDLDRVFAAVAIQVLLDPSAFAQDETKSAYLLSHFRGPALDWAARTIDKHQAWLANYPSFCSRVRTQFGYDEAQAVAVAQTQLAALQQKGDLVEFLAEYDDVTSRAGINSDTSKIAFLLPKLKKRYQDAIVLSGDLITNFSSLRLALCNINAREATSSVPLETKRNRARCKKCGKRGHTASQCVTTN